MTPSTEATGPAVRSPVGITVRRLTPPDAAAFHALRLAGLRDTPSAFGSSHEEEVGLSQAAIEARLAVHPDRGVFGAFSGQQLVGLVALGREGQRKLAHKGMVWGMYVSPDVRGQGVGRALLLQALALARSVPDMLQVNLSVNASNVAALRLYESVGFQAFGREAGGLLVHGAFHDEVHMCLRLRPGPPVPDVAAGPAAGG